jgi:N-dimethylarginine dimethylaminohydrolase
MQRTFVMSGVHCRERPSHVGDVGGVGCTYRVAWSINPHMRIGAVDEVVARAQHHALERALESLGAEVHVLPFVCGAFDSVFVKDNAILRWRGRPAALLARPLHPERRAEQRARADAYARCGFEVHAAPAAPLEGGDVVMLPQVGGPEGAALLGCGPRSSPKAAAALVRFLDTEVVPLSLRDPRLYHLDTACAALPDGTLLYCPEAFEPRARATLRRLVERGVLAALVAVPCEEALRFSLNLVPVGTTVITGADPARVPATTRAIERAGFSVVHVPLDQFHLAGGSAACLVAEVRSHTVLSQQVTARSA